MLLQIWISSWLEMFIRPQYLDNTYWSKYYISRTLMKYCEDKKLDQYDDEYLQTMLNKMNDNKFSKATLIKELFSSAYQLHKTDTLIGQSLILPRGIPPKIIKALTREEQKSVENACDSVVGGHIIIFLLYTGLRRCEFINLKWSDYNTKEKTLSITTSKTAAGIRTIKLPDKAQHIIDNLRPTSDYVFVTSANHPYNEKSIKRVYMRIREITGINSFTTHICRHTFATRLVEENVNPKAVANLLGHAKIEYSLKIYTTLDKMKTIHEVKRLNSLKL